MLYYIIYIFVIQIFCGENMSVQLNVRTSESLIKEIDKTVKEGLYKNRSEAVNEALRLLVRQYRVRKADKVMRETAEKLKGYPSLTKAVLESREEVDEL
jgi:Arc/MetJ-type ribon-helix-helix transcriptional regulator